MEVGAPFRHTLKPLRAHDVSGDVEVDGAFIGGLEGNKHYNKRLFNNWRMGRSEVMGAVQRNGPVITQVVPHENEEHVLGFILTNIYRDSTVYSDEHGSFNKVSWYGFIHRRVNHGRGIYVDGDSHSNTIESFWAILKRGFKGVYHHWSKKHLDLYLGEYEIRWNLRDVSEGRRFVELLENVNGNRLTYRQLIQ